jgi:hypothetical protein
MPRCEPGTYRGPVVVPTYGPPAAIPRLLQGMLWTIVPLAMRGPTAALTSERLPALVNVPSLTTPPARMLSALTHATGKFFILPSLIVALASQTAAAAPPPAQVPVIHCTDLYFPPMDVDDYFDLAALYAIPEIDLKAVILDHGKLQQSRPGAIPVAMMNRITGRAVPHAIGLGEKLQRPADKGLDQPEAYQGGIKLILDILRQADRPVIIDAVGSMRDVAAAFNREPELFRKKVGKLFIFIGDADQSASITFKEYNVGLDPNAYKAVMRSGLPIYWVPCFDGGDGKNNGRASYWTARHADLLKGASDPTLQFFIHAYRKTAAPDPAAFVQQTPDEAARRHLLEITKQLWVVAVATCFAERKFILDGQRYRTLPSGAAGEARPIFGFTEKQVTIGDDASIVYGPGPQAKPIQCFTILDRAHYAQALTDASAELLGGIGK